MSVSIAVNLSALPDPTDTTQQELIVDATLTLSGNYGAANGHGDVLALGGLDAVRSNQVPVRVEIYEAPTAGNAPVGYVFIYAPGVDINSGKLVVMQCGGAAAPFAEITQGNAYPAALIAAAANIRIRAWFPKFI